MEEEGGMGSENLTHTPKTNTVLSL